MSKATEKKLSKYVHELLKQEVLRDAGSELDHNKPLTRDGGELFVRYNEIRIEPRGEAAVISFCWRGRMVFEIVSDHVRLARDGVVVVSGVDGRASINVE